MLNVGDAMNNSASVKSRTNQRRTIVVRGFTASGVWDLGGIMIYVGADPWISSAELRTRLATRSPAAMMMPNSHIFISSAERLFYESSLAPDPRKCDDSPSDWNLVAVRAAHSTKKYDGIFMSGVQQMEIWKLMERLEDERGGREALGGTIAYAAHLTATQVGKPNGKEDPEPGAGQTWRVKTPLFTSYKPFMEDALVAHDFMLDVLIVVARNEEDIVEAHTAVGAAELRRGLNILLVAIPDATVGDASRATMENKMCSLYEEGKFSCASIE